MKVVLFLTFIFNFSFLSAEAVELTEVVFVPAEEQPFFMKIFEASKREAVEAGVRTGYSPSNYKKPDRMSVIEAKEYCENIGMSLSSLRQWKLAATNLGRNQFYSTINDSMNKVSGYYESNISSADSDTIYMYWKHGIDAIGTVALTGNRPEWAISENGEAYQCGGGYETNKLEYVRLDRICSKNKSDWVSRTATARCTYEVNEYFDATVNNDTEEINHIEGNVQITLSSYLEKINLNLPRPVEGLNNAVVEREGGIFDLLFQDTLFSDYENEDPTRLRLTFPEDDGIDDAERSQEENLPETEGDDNA